MNNKNINDLTLQIMETLVKRNGSLPSVGSLFEDFFSKDIFNWADKNFAASGSNLPSVNLRETDNELEVELAAPGMQKEDFKVEVENNMLIISSEKQQENEDKEDREGYIRREFNYQSFYRSFTLPEYVDEENIEANYRDGILHVTIAKKDDGRRRGPRNIQIQ